MNQWYLSKNGKAQGPLDESKIISLIKTGEIGHLDLVFKAGNTEWTPISKVEEFQEYLKKDEPVAVSANNEIEWVLLKKTRGEKGSQYKQLGPFSKNQVLDLVERGEVKFQDFAWRQGFDAWVPLGSVEEFSEPLPSTPKVDTDLYGPLSEDTQVDEEALSLTGLVEIEHFEHEKTQVMSASDIPLNSTGFATETDVDAPSQSISALQSELPESEEVEEDEAQQTDADLWSLEPPETKSEVKLQSPVKNRSKKKKAPKPKSKKEKIKRPTISLEESPWPWVAAACVLFLSVIFLYISFSGPTDEYAQKEEAPSEFEQLSWEDGPVESELEEEVESQEQSSLASSQDPQLGMGSIDTRNISSSKKEVKKKKKKKKVAAQVKKKPRKIAKKKTIKPIKKKVTKAKKTQEKPKVASGSKKAKSFYKQRDRKALFYSSLKVESLIVELERNFKKLKKNKKSWKSFYGKWKRKAGSSALPTLVRRFPEKNNTYAYPQLIGSFKKDYSLVSKYGAAYNARVLGLRRPAGAPKNLKEVFSKYKKQAQRLGK